MVSADRAVTHLGATHTHACMLTQDPHGDHTDKHWSLNNDIFFLWTASFRLLLTDETEQELGCYRDSSVLNPQGTMSTIRQGPLTSNFPLETGSVGGIMGNVVLN